MFLFTTTYDYHKVDGQIIKNRKLLTSNGLNNLIRNETD